MVGEVVHSHIHPVAEERGFDTQVELGLLLPLEFGVGHIGAVDGTDVEEVAARVVVLAVVRREAAVAAQATLSGEVQLVHPLWQFACVGEHHCDTGRGEEAPAGGIGARGTRTIDGNTRITADDAVVGIGTLQVEAQVVPLGNVAEAALLVLGVAQCLIVIARGIVTLRHIPLILFGYHAGGGGEVQFVYLVEQAVVGGFQHEGVHILGEGAVAHLVLACAVELGQDGGVGHTGDEEGLLGVVVVEVDHGGQREVVVPLEVDARLGVHVINLVLGTHTVDDGHRVAHVVVGIHRLSGGVPAVVTGQVAQYRTVTLFLVGIEERHGPIAGEHTVGGTGHAHVLQVAGDIGEADVGEDINLAAGQHVGTDEGVILVRAGVTDGSLIACIAEGDVVFGNLVTSFYTEEVLGHEARLLDILGPVGVLVEEV